MPKRKKPDPESVDVGYSFETHAAPEELSIKPVETSKDKIKQPELAEHDDMFIPPLGSSIIISGKSGSGKSTLLSNLITDHRFYGPSEQHPNGWFDKIFLFSPTANGDDIQKSLGIDPKYVFTDLDEAEELLEVILDSQQDKIDDESADTVEQYCIIYDDFIGNVKFMNTKAFARTFYQVRHVNCTTIACTQHFKRVPRMCRLQANFIFFFQGSSSEVETVCEEFAPPEYTSKEFKTIVNEATRTPYSFLTINMKVPWAKRLRRNLDEFIKLPRLTDEQEESTGTNKDTKRTKEYARVGEKSEHLVENSINLRLSDQSTEEYKDGPNE